MKLDPGMHIGMHLVFFGKAGVTQLKLTDLTSVTQRKEESVSDYLKRFKEVKDRCFNLSLTDSDLADLAAGRLRPAIRDS
jgi:hypothetical protein